MSENQTLNRRAFLAVAATAATCACAASCPFALAADAAAEAGPLEVGTLADYAKDGPYDKFAGKGQNVLLVRREGKLYAPTAICTHKKKNLKVEDGEIICPAHDSPFDNEGVPKAKTKDGEDTPATKPLARHAISVNAAGKVVVDRSKSFDKDKWDDAASFVKIPA